MGQDININGRDPGLARYIDGSGKDLSELEADIQLFSVPSFDPTLL
jgi:hypothetical protein